MTNKFKLLALDCSVCKTERVMQPTTVSKMSNPVRAIGIILLIPSFIGMLFGLLMMFVSLTPSAVAADDKARHGFGVLMVGFSAIIIVLPSFVLGLLGWLLLMKKKIYKCQRCGFILDRA